MSWPLALAGFFSTIYSQIDSVMMGYLGQITQTGWYNAALRIVIFTTLPANLLSQSVYPALSIAAKKSREDLQKIWDHQIEIMLFFAIPLVVGGITLASKIINFVYDESFAPAALAFQILLLMAGLVFLSTPLSTTLVAVNQERKTFWVALSGVVINIILNSLLIPKYSLYGAAFATIVTYFLMLFLLAVFIIKNTSIYLFNKNIFLNLVTISLSSAIMYFALSQLSFLANFHVLLLILLGIIVYFISFFILNFFNKKLWSIHSNII
jgi:O-antigen/teichoic acid export membrane protein